MKLAKLTAALVAAGLALPVIAAPDTATLQKLVERMEKLEARNAELEKQVKSLQGESEEIAKGLDSPRLSQYEPELTVRLKAVEKDALEMKKSASLADKFDGIKVGAALTTVAQHASGLPQGTTDAGGQLNYRADVTVELPLQAIDKMDIFGFFDQNTAAGDESRQFLNSVFVHNPLLDAGGEVGVDANGFQPGFVASYVNARDKMQPWRLSFGVFGAGERGANYQKSLSQPLLMAQAETQLKLFGGLNGNYRIYGWNRSEADAFDGTSSKHTGVGASVDQRLGDGVNVFARYGKMLKGELPFNQALAIGAEFNGSYWGRAADAIGIGGSWLQSGKAFRANPATAYLDSSQLHLHAERRRAGCGNLLPLPHLAAI